MVGQAIHNAMMFLGDMSRYWPTVLTFLVFQRAAKHCQSGLPKGAPEAVASEVAEGQEAKEFGVNAEEAEQLATERGREGPRLIEWFGMIFGSVIIFFLFLSWIKKAIDWISE